MKAYVSGDLLCLEFDYDPYIIDRVKAHIKSCRWNPLFKRWEMPYSKENLEASTTIGFDTRHILKKIAEIRQAKEDQFDIQAEGIRKEYPFLYPFQVNGVTKAILNSSLLFADEMGLGKSVQAYAVADWHLKRGHIANVVIVGPKSIGRQWRGEVKRFFNRELVVVEGDYDERRAIYDQRPQTLFMNYELFTTKMSHNGVKILKDFHDLIPLINNQMFILDEMSWLKNPRTQRTIHIKRFHPKYLLGLTGTPIENRLRDAYVLGNIVFPNWMQKHEFYRYCIYDKIKVGRREVSKLQGYCNIDEFMRRLMQISIRRMCQDVIKDTPPLIIQTRNIPLTVEQTQFEEILKAEIKRQYKQGITDTMLHQFVLLQMLEDGIELLKLSTAKAILPLKEDLNKVKQESNKIKDLKLILEELEDNKIIIFTRFKKMAKMIVGELDDSCILATGDENKHEALKNFKSIPEARLLVATDAMAYGVDIPEASVVINFDLLWNPQKMRQRIYRCYRPAHKDANKKRTLAINMVSDGLEEYMYRVMGEKALLSKKALAFNLQEQLIRFVGGK